MEALHHQQIKKYANLLYRWKAFVFICFLLSFAASIAFYLVTPKTYRATTLLIYEKQKVSPSKMSPDVRTVTREIVSTLSQQVTSRTTLETLIKSNDLYPTLRARFPMEDVIEEMRKHVKIHPTKGDIFQVSFEGDNPKKVLKVTNALAAKFIEENLRFREESATETSVYIQKELEIAKKSLDEKEAVMRDYKLKFYNEMPQQREINVQRINALQVQLQGKQESIQDLERTKVLIQEQLAGTKRVQVTPAPESPPRGDKASEQTAGADADDAADRLEKIRAYLDTLLLKYTENHPEVQRVRRLLAAMEQEAASQKPARPRTVRGGDASGEKAAAGGNKLQAQLNAQLKDLERGIENLRTEQGELRQQIERYQGWISSAPVREAEWSALTRDYDELKRHYDYLVAQNLQAESATHLERQQKGSQFKVVDPARLPETPAWPNIYRILGMGIAAGLGIAFCCIFLVDFFDFTFREAHEFEAYLNLPVSCTIPYIETRAEKRWRRIKIGIWIIVFFLTIVLLALTFWYLVRRNLITF